MSKLKNLSNAVSVLRLGTNIGFISKGNSECIVIDTGIDDDYGRRILKIISQLRCKNIFIINTHSHADHIGGNNYLYKKLGVKIYAHPREVNFIKDTILTPTILYGAPPPMKLKTKLLYPKPVTEIYSVYDMFRGNDLEIIELPGHSPGMIGLSYDNVLFTADAFFNKRILEKYKIPFHFNVFQALGSLRKLKTIIMEKHYDFIVPSHGEVLSPDKALEIIDYNIQVIEDIWQVIKNIIYERKTITIEDLITSLFKKYRINIKSVEEYFFLRTCIKSYLTWLVDNNVIELYVENNQLLLSPAE